MLSAGLGPDYDGSPYARFGGNPDRTTLQLASTSVDSVLAYQVLETVDIGLSLNTGYQQFSAKGLEFLDDPTLSSSPGQVTDQGKDGVFTFGASLGVVWRINPWLTAGASYRSKNHNGKHKDYRGLIAGEDGWSCPPSMVVASRSWRRHASRSQLKRSDTPTAAATLLATAWTGWKQVFVWVRQMARGSVMTIRMLTSSALLTTCRRD